MRVDHMLDLIVAWEHRGGGGGRRDRTLYADFPPSLPAGFWPGSAGPWAPKAKAP